MRTTLSITTLMFSMSISGHCAAEADLAVGFTASYVNGVGGLANAEVNALNAVAGSNAINSRSGSPARMRLVGVYQSLQDNTNRTSTGGIVSWLANNDSRIRDVVDFGNSLGADLVAYVCANNDSASIGAVAQQPGRYSSFNPASFWSTVLAHETGGHNYGCDHRGGDDNPKTVMMHNYCGGGSQGYFSNPNIWLGGRRLLGTGTCLGAAVNGGDNTFVLSNNAQGRADARDRILYGSNLGPTIHRWKFNAPAGSAPAGTTIVDDVAGTLATVKGQGAIFTGSGLRLPGGTTGNTSADSIAAYLDLPNGIFSKTPNFTIEIWATPRSAQNWMRIIDIGRTSQSGDGLGAPGEYTGAPGSAAPGVTDASDDLMLTACEGTTLNGQRFEAKLNGAGTQTANSNLATTVGQLYHYAITFSNSPSGGTVKWFRNGGLIRTLSVPFRSADLEDVNNWLGRSMYSGDAMAHIDYHDVRIQGAALLDGQIAANYLIGPFDAKATMWASDAIGRSGFVDGAWEFGAVPNPARDYETGEMRLRTPNNGANHTWPGKSLTVTGGELLYKGTGASTVTFDDLRLAGGDIVQAGSAATATIAGTINVTGGTRGYNHVRAAGGPINISAKIIGGFSMLYTNEPVTLSGDNTGFDGWTIIGDGRFSTLVISSEENLGRNPPWFGGDWLTLNRGILQTNNNVVIDDPNRCVRVGTSAALFRPISNTTLTIATPLTCGASGNTLRTEPLDSNPIAGQLIKQWGGTLNLTNPNNSHNGEIIVDSGELRLSGSGRLNNGDHWMPITNNGVFNYDSVLNQTLRGAISGGGAIVKNNVGTLNINGQNPFSGSVTVNGGTLVANPGNAANNRAFSFVSSITINDGGTLRAGPNGLFGWDGLQDRPITVNSGGLLVANGGLGSDVGVGIVTLNGGVLATLSPGATDWGSWRFDNTGDRLLVTADSVVSANNVKFGDPGAAIDIRGGSTLNFTGTMSDATGGGISHLRKTGGGTLLLAGSNTYSGSTLLEGGITRVTGSIGSSTVSVATNATFGGGGSVGGSTTINGIHEPGDGVGTQDFGSAIAYGASSRVKWELASNSVNTGTFDKVTSAGKLTIEPGAVVDVILNRLGGSVSLDDPFWTQPHQWTFMTAGSISGTFTLGTVTADQGGRTASAYGTFSLQHNANSTALVYMPNDSNGSSGYQLWQQTHFGSDWNNSAISGDLVDHDQDGLSNLMEYAFGSDPNAVDPEALPQVSTENGKLRISFTRSITATEVTITVVASDNLESPWTEVAKSVNASPMTSVAEGAVVVETGEGDKKSVHATDIYLMDDPLHPKRFMRVQVSR